MKTNANTLSTMQELDSHATMAWRSWQIEGRECRKQYRGKQWDEATKNALEASGRAALTINRILPTVNWMAGTQRQNPRDIAALARRGGVAIIANVLTELAKDVMALDENNGNLRVADMFLQGVITGKGFVWLDVDYALDPFSGDLRIHSPSPFDVSEDPGSEDYLLTDAKFIKVRRWMRKDYVEAKYPDAAKDLQGKGTIDKMKAHGEVDWKLSLKAAVDMVYGEDIDEADSDRLTEINKYRYPVQITYWRETKTVVAVLDERTGERAMWDPKTDAQAIAAVKQLAAAHPRVYRINERHVINQVNRTTWCNDVILEHEDDLYDGLDLIPVFRFAPYWDEGELFGVVQNLLGPQAELNKRRSQQLHIINQVANGGWVVPRRGNHDAMDRLEEHGASTGLVLVAEDYGGEPKKIQPNQLPHGHQVLEEKAGEDFHEISGVNIQNMGGDPGRQESGRLNLLRQRQGMAINEVVFDNFDATFSKFASGLVELIRHTDVYTPDEIRHIIDEKDLVDDQLVQQSLAQLAESDPLPVVADPTQLAQLSMEQAQAMVAHDEQAVGEWMKRNEPVAKQMAITAMLGQMKDWKTGRYAIEVSESPEAPTRQFAEQQELHEMAQLYPGLVDPETLVDASQLRPSTKQKLQRNIQSGAAAAAAAEAQAT
jgi:hypothetical protein